VLIAQKGALGLEFTERPDWRSNQKNPQDVLVAFQQAFNEAVFDITSGS
jgi:hypothetical protein